MVRVPPGARALVSEDICVAALQDRVDLGIAQRHQITVFSAQHFFDLQGGDDAVHVLHSSHRVAEVVSGGLQFLIKARHERDVVNIASVQPRPCGEKILGDTSHQLLGRLHSDITTISNYSLWLMSPLP